MPLEVGALMHDLLVPMQPQPLESLEDGPRARLRAASLVGVLDAQQKLAAVVLDEEPVEERRASATDVQITGRRRCESQAMWGSHVRKVSGIGTRNCVNYKS